MQNIVHYILHYPRAEQESIYGLNFVCEAWTEVSLATSGIMSAYSAPGHVIPSSACCKHLKTTTLNLTLI